MKKCLLALLFVLLSIQLFADSPWKEVQAVEIPQGTTVYYSKTDSGNLKYCIKVNDMTISVSEINAVKFVNGEIRLELVKWYNPLSGKYKYTTRRISANSRNIDLSTVFQ